LAARLNARRGRNRQDPMTSLGESVTIVNGPGFNLLIALRVLS
jgi:hypothetical protein